MPKDKIHQVEDHRIERAVLVGLVTKKQSEQQLKEYLDELEFLAETAGAQTEEKFWQAWALLLGKESEVIDLMIDLKKYYKIWLLSNTNSKHIKDELDNKYVFPHLVDGAIYSFDVGLRKPDELIYQKSCEKANVLPNECIFIDDLEENIKGAKKVGLHGLHYTEMENLQNDLKLLGLIK